MKSLMYILTIGMVITLIVVPSLQYYNFSAFKYDFENDKIFDILINFKSVDDTQASVARQRIKEEITSKGYKIKDEDIVFTAVLIGAPWMYSEQIYQINSSKVKYPQLIVEITFTTKLLIFDRKVTLTHTKDLKNKLGN